jgi:hypothetical protein
MVPRSQCRLRRSFRDCARRRFRSLRAELPRGVRDGVLEPAGSLELSGSALFRRLRTSTATITRIARPANMTVYSTLSPSDSGPQSS